MTELKYQISITLIPGIGDILAKKLIAYCGSAEGVFKEKKQNLLRINGVGDAIAQAIINQNVYKRAEEEIEFIHKHNIRPLFYLEKSYPSRLKNCYDSPVMLYYKGNSNLNHQKVISIVGTRNMTEYGKAICEKLVQDLVAHSPIIVSGLAYGVDICAHKAALNNNLETVGVLAHGLDRIYPSLHKSTAEKMLQQGGLITDFLSKTNPDRENFPKRNRIVAGMADAVIVVEAGNKGGALITADIANSYNRDVFAVPGKLNDTYSQGCNRLIKTNKAALIESMKDLEYLLGWQLNDAKKAEQKKLFLTLNKEEEILVDLLRAKGNLPIDELCFESNISLSKLSMLLLNLEFNGVLKSLPGKVYQLID